MTPLEFGLSAGPMVQVKISGSGGFRRWTMPCFATQIGPLAGRENLAAKRPPGHRCLQISILALVFCSLGSMSATAAAPAGQSAPTAWVGQGLTFAIADFDGDQRPDLASVEAGRIGSSSTDYWIQLQLTASGRQAIHLVAPPGGLLIEARDVNGDDAVDLILSTAWFKQPVAILLNDGHGRFSRAEPSAFPRAFEHAPRHWGSSSNQGREAVGIPPQPRSGMCSEAARVPDVRGPAEPARAFPSGFLPDSLLIAYAGRAPPTEVPCL